VAPDPAAVQCDLWFNTIMIADRLGGIEIRHLMALRAVDETRSFSRAAERLGYAQSAVSQQIASLERAVGLRLVERPGGPRPVSLTEAGTILARHGDRILGRLGAARADLEALAGGTVGTVRVGTFQSAGARVLPAVLARFREAWPQVKVEVAERQSDDELFDLVAAGQLDLTFGLERLDAPRPAFDRIELLHDPYVVLAPPWSRLADRDSIDLAELDGEDVIANQLGSCCEPAIERMWRESGATPNVVFRTDDNLTLQRVVGAGLGHALVSELTVERGVDAGSAVVIPLRVGQSRCIAIYWQRDRYRSPAARAFAETAGEVCAARPEVLIPDPSLS
jgi:DNA-binding transcriptional LysR family regulator